jgi:hypothetical protein
MRFLYRRGKGARRRVMHLTPFDSRSGEPTMRALCGSPQPFDTTCNFPLGQRVCKRCKRALAPPVSQEDPQ